MKTRICCAALAVLFVLAGVTHVRGKDPSYLAPPGAPASAFLRAERPVAEIVSSSRSTEAKRDANNKSRQVACLLGLTSGMTVGDVGAGSGYHTVRLSRVFGPTGTVIAQNVSRQYLTQLVCISVEYRA